MLVSHLCACMMDNRVNNYIGLHLALMLQMSIDIIDLYRE